MDLTNIILNATNAQAAYDQQQTFGMVLSMVIGLCGGLSVAFFGLVKRQGWIGAGGFVACLIGGYLGGWFLVVPLTIGLNALINDRARKVEAAEQAARTYQENTRRENAAANERRAEATRKAEAARWEAQARATAPQSTTPARPNVPQRKSVLVAPSWNAQIEHPEIRIEDTGGSVRITTTPVVTLYRGIYPSPQTRVGDTPLEIAADGQRHLLGGYVGSAGTVWATSITIDAADPQATAVPEPTPTLIGGLERLAALYRSGTLSDEEFVTAKAQLLNATTS